MATKTDAPTEGWLSADEMRAWRNFVETMGTLLPAMEADLVAHGLTMGDYEVLVHLSEAEHRRMRMCDLATALRLSPSGLTRRLDGLVKAKLVTRESCAADRRVMWAALTAAGWERMEEAAPTHVASVRRHFLAGLTPAMIEAIGDAFTIVRERLAAGQTA
ncbi:unnamed protein product [Phaeothamnion confervicola]